MRAPAFILAYHGCDKSVGEKVLAGEAHLVPSDNDYDWLGSGIYFWENSAGRALDWARLAKQNPRVSKAVITEPFVVGAIIDLGNCLDLLEAESIRIVEGAHDQLRMAHECVGVPLPQNRSVDGQPLVRHLDCAVVNYVHVLRKEAGHPAFDTVRAAFFEGEALYPNAGFQRRTHIQVCVRHARSIRGYFRPVAPSA